MNQLNNDGVAAVSKVQKLLAENEKDLKCQIIFIEVNFSFLPTAIEKIQKRQPLADAFSVLHSVKEKVSIAEYKTKLDLSLAKIPIWQFLKIMRPFSVEKPLKLETSSRAMF